MGKRTRRSKKGVNGSQQSEQRDPSGPNGNLKVGELYVLDGQLVRLKRRAAHGRVEVLDEMNGIHHFPFPGELRPRDFKSNEDKSATIECAVLTEEQQGKSLDRWEIIKPIIGLIDRGRTAVQAVARKAGLSERTVYRWLQEYEESGDIESLAPDQQGMPKGTVLIDPRAERIITDVIKGEFARGRSGIAVSDVVQDINTACDELNDRPSVRWKRSGRYRSWRSIIRCWMCMSWTLRH